MCVCIVCDDLLKKSVTSGGCLYIYRCIYTAATAPPWLTGLSSSSQSIQHTHPTHRSISGLTLLSSSSQSTHHTHPHSFTDGSISGLKGMGEAEADAQLSKFIVVFKYLQVRPTCVSFFFLHGID